MKTILMILLAACCGCSALKQMAPNGWNANYYEPTDGNRAGQTISVGVSGALPWGKQ